MRKNSNRNGNNVSKVIVVMKHKNKVALTSTIKSDFNDHLP